MGNLKLFRFNTQLDLVNKGPVNEVFFKKMVLFVGSFWFSVTTYMFFLVKFITRYFFRFQRGDNSQKENLNCSTVPPLEDDQIVSNCIELEPEVIGLEDSEYDGCSESETPKFCFKFEYQTSEITRQSNGESENSVSHEMSPSTSSNGSKYQFSSGKDFSRFVEEEQEIVSFNVKEFSVDSNHGSFSNEEILDGGLLLGKDILQLNSETEVVLNEMLKNPTDYISIEEKPETPEAVASTEDQLSEKEHLSGSEDDSMGKEHNSDDVQFLSEKDFLTSDSDSESLSLSDESHVKDDIIDSNGNEFLSEGDFGGEFECKTPMDFDVEDVEFKVLKKPIYRIQSSEVTHFQNSSILDTDASDVSNESSPAPKLFVNVCEGFDGEEMELVEEIKSSAKHHFQNSSILGTQFLSEKYFCSKPKQEDFGGKDTEPTDGFENFEPNVKKTSVSESEDSARLETLWEHQDLIEQLKMELSKMRATGLPTILEESESPKMSEELKPWKIDEKFLHEDRMDELHKFYKTYTERMRKFDILNYQKMYALGFLQQKDPLESISSRKSSIPGIASIVTQNLWLTKRQRPETEPTMKFIRELQGDLEMVYVGQVCLSWEFLHWQYWKVQELHEADPHGIRRYNQVAGAFQQFQVLVQRFVENEPFQGPRIQNYIKNRCILRNLLQVPAIKEDCSKDKMKGGRSRKRGEDDNVITIGMLTEIIEESMHIFWEFLRADKDEANVILKGLSGTQVELQDPADSKLFTDIRANLQKKEKKLKDLLRSGNCIVKKFQKHREDRPDQVLFFSQVDVKLVWRVLNMSRITSDQLAWCLKKLNKITFANRKIQREPSFVLFPC